MSEIDGSAAPVAAAVEAPSAPIAPAPAPEPVNVTAPPIATVDQPSLHEPPKPSKDGVVPRELDWAPDAQPAGIAELFGQARERHSLCRHLIRLPCRVHGRRSTRSDGRSWIVRRRRSFPPARMTAT